MKAAVDKRIAEAIFQKIFPFVATAILSVGIKMLFDWWKDNEKASPEVVGTAAFVPLVLGAMLVAVALSISTLGS